jgi:ElaB/YqjD/DUF883 family membrane-anchored ribosome-binding protein
VRITPTAAAPYSTAAERNKGSIAGRVMETNDAVSNVDRNEKLTAKANATIDDVAGQATGAAANVRSKVAEKVTEGGHRLQETAQKVGHRAKEIAAKVVHSAQETAQKVLHRAKEAATTVQHRGDEHVQKTGREEEGK